jgi:hypothetical protein
MNKEWNTYMCDKPAFLIHYSLFISNNLSSALSSSPGVQKEAPAFAGASSHVPSFG